MELQRIHRRSERRTPPRTECSRTKICYTTFSAAAYAARGLRKRWGVPASAYRCKVCQAFHAGRCFQDQ